MGIESDQLVFDYLSRVGDLAQQRQLPSGTRMQLVSSLRNEIDRQRAKYGTDSPAAVQRILGRLGTPDEVVDGANPGADPRSRRRLPEGGTDAAASAADTAPASVPEQRTAVPEDPGTPETSSGPAVPGAGPGVREPDWWRIERGRPEDANFGAFVGGVEIPELLRPPRRNGEDEEGRGSVAGGPEKEGAPRRGMRRWLRRTGAAGAEGGAGAPAAAPPAAPPRGPVRLALGNPMLLFAATLLAVGAVLGSLVALAGGWLLAYATRTLSRTEAKWAVLGIPGLVATGAAVWIWGRVEGRWGDPIAPGGEALGETLTGAWPWVVRGAAVASALFLLWRARRR
ncbi:hypothetical protein OTC26_014170 [Streptomyces tirandamycinicus]|uniref:hypothetical protein n=1 Tax=Streptomyces tirandamycinicus TaxID=2174846 RepID=UPI00226E76D8|nr:hypothetical protein [Streptomyces tirandamycinicus]MCY0980144.1 hypothetical protein [Streptomyces tirandamycinicus]